MSALYLVGKFITVIKQETNIKQTIKMNEEQKMIVY